MDETFERLHRELRLKQRELDLILAVDAIRDAAPGPSAMLSGIVKVIADQFQAGLCLLYLFNPETDDLELKVVNERGIAWERVNHFVSPEMLEQAVHSRGVFLWDLEPFPIEAPATGSSVPLHWASIPIFMEVKRQTLGVLVLGRASAPLTPEEVQLLEMAESQIDSAVVQAHTYHELALRNKELETIYQFDHIRDQNLPFDEMLNVVLQELCTVIQAQMGFVMLYDQQGRRLEMRAITHGDLLADPAYAQTIVRVANEAVEQATLLCYKEVGEAQCNILCVPLILRGEILGVFGAINRKGHLGFTLDDERLLKAIVSQMDTAILESLERRRLRRLLGRSLDPYVLERLLADPNVDILKGERSLLTVLYGDLRGSTALSERLAPELLVAFINDYLGRMTEVLLSREGMLDKFIGDAVMALFGAPLPQHDHALRAVQAGVMMQKVYRELAEVWYGNGIEAGGLGVGIATGELIVGEMGCERRTDYTVIGLAANLGARICTVAQPNQVLISEATYALVKDQVEVTPIPGMRFKGLGDPVTVYDVNRVVGVG